MYSKLYTIQPLRQAEPLGDDRAVRTIYVAGELALVDPSKWLANAMGSVELYPSQDLP